jgi:hypothetical protein
MDKKEIIHTAIENLENQAGIKAEWLEWGNPALDGRVRFELDDGNKDMFVEAKSIINHQHLPNIEKLANLNPAFMVVAERIQPELKTTLREKQIAYLEGNGNLFIRDGRTYVWIDGNKPLKPAVEKGNRAFTKTGIKVLLHFITDQRMVNYTYREIALATGVALGNVTNIINGLKEYGFLVKIDANTLKLVNTKELLEKWVTGYNEKLKPTLILGRYRLLNDDQFIHWKDLHLPPDTVWGGEPAGDIYTHYLRPGALTIYSNEGKAELMKHFKMIPDKEKGNVWVYKKCWQMLQPEKFEMVAPPIITYADLMDMNDKRCRETAQIIFDEYIKPNL